MEKLVEVNGFDMEIALAEHMVFLTYTDRPGIVGVVGQILGGEGINIAGMQVSGTRGAGTRSSPSPSTPPSRRSCSTTSPRRSARSVGRTVDLDIA